MPPLADLALARFTRTIYPRSGSSSLLLNRDRSFAQRQIAFHFALCVVRGGASIYSDGLGLAQIGLKAGTLDAEQQA
jgi:hypothetical protein